MDVGSHSRIEPNSAWCEVMQLAQKKEPMARVRWKRRLDPAEHGDAKAPVVSLLDTAEHVVARVPPVIGPALGEPVGVPSVQAPQGEPVGVESVPAPPLQVIAPTSSGVLCTQHYSSQPAMVRQPWDVAHGGQSQSHRQGQR